MPLQVQVGGLWPRCSAEPALCRVAAVKGDEPLASVTVVVPSNHVGVATRRLLASGRVGPACGRGVGLAAIDFPHAVPAGRAAGRRPVGRGRRRPVSTPVIAAAMRAAWPKTRACSPRGPHPATETALVAAYRELRDLSAAALDALGETSRRRRCRPPAPHHPSPTGAGVVRRAGPDRRRRRGVRDGDPLVADLGAVIVYLPQRLSGPSARLLATLASIVGVGGGGRTGDVRADPEVRRFAGPVAGRGALADQRTYPPADSTRRPGSTCDRTRFVTASDADEEVAGAVRAVVDAVRGGTPLDRIAILYASPEPYARLCTSSSAPPAWPSTAPRHSPVRPGGRSDAAGSAGPARRRVPPPGRLRLARRRAVPHGPAGAGRRVGAAVPRRRRRRRAQGLGRRLVELAHLRGTPRRPRSILTNPTGGPAGPSRRRPGPRPAAVRPVADRRAGGCGLGPRPWAEHARWAQGAGRLLGGPARRRQWPVAERKAAERVEWPSTAWPPGGRRGTGRPRRLRPHPGARARGRPRPGRTDGRGRAGRVGRHGRRLDLDLVVVLGLAEGLFPAPVRDDSLLPDHEREATGGRAAAAAAGGSSASTASCWPPWPAPPTSCCASPVAISAAAAERVPSRWVLDIASALAGERWWSEELPRRRAAPGSTTSPPSTPDCAGAGVPGDRAGAPPALAAWRQGRPG